jgi:hypothetical protein
MILNMGLCGNSVSTVEFRRAAALASYVSFVSKFFPLHQNMNQLNGISSIGQHLLEKAHIAKLNKFTESEDTELTWWTVDETAVAILKKQGSRQITLVSS